MSNCVKLWIIGLKYVKILYLVYGVWKDTIPDKPTYICIYAYSDTILIYLIRQT